MLPAIDFKQIRPHGGAQDRGFEELCCQLAHLEAHPDGEFVRKGEGGDAGVECFWRLSDGSEHGWQAKYLFELGKSGISQLNKSFQEAFAKHPRLSRYVVCVPFDLSDARATRKGKPLKSELERWNELVTVWTAQASQQGRSIGISLWSASRIAGLLQDDRPEYAGKVLYWFGSRCLSPSLLRKRVEIAIENLGPRYTPELHVDLSIAQVLDGLCWHESFRERIRKLRRRLYQAANSCQREMQDKTGLESVQEALLQVLFGSKRLADALGVLSNAGPCAEAVQSLCDAAADVDQHAACLANKLFDLGWEGAEGDKDLNDRPENANRRQLDRARYAASESRASLAEAEQFLASHQVSASATRALLVRGEAGTGKSHLLADVARTRVKAGLPTVLVLGQHVLQGDPWEAVRRALDLSEQPAAYILGALDSAAEASRSRAMVAVDAINEGAGARVWRDQLAGFLQEARALPRVTVVLTCRTAFERRCAPPEIKEPDLVRIEHRGFAGHTTQALQAYFDGQGLARPSAPILSAEFHNPLFLKTVTKALLLAGLSALPHGLHGVKQIMDFYGKCLDAAVAREFEIPEGRHLGVRALRMAAKLLAESSHEWLPRAQLIKKLDGITDGRGRELLDLLIAEGALLDDVHYLDEADEVGSDVVRFAYQRFSDHYVAARLLRDHLDSQAPEESFAPGTVLGKRFRGEAFWDNAGIAEAMAIQVPGACGREFVALVGAEDYQASRLIEDFLASIVWRDRGDFTDETFEWLKRTPELTYGHPIEDTLLRVTTEPGHPYNADFLHKKLIVHSMPDRDAFWSTYLAASYHEDRYSRDELGPAHEIVDWAWQADKKNVETERLRLCAIALTWMLSTSHRELRDRATKGLVSVLVERPSLTLLLFEYFEGIDDPYVRERLYAAAYGAALNHRDLKTVTRVADTAFRLIFSGGEPPPHLLLRDYARGLVELAAHLAVLPDGIDVVKVRPPYRSAWPLQVPAMEGQEAAREQGDAIAHSVFHDDFNSYTMTSLTRWSATPLGEAGLRTTRSAYDAFRHRLRERGDPEELAAFERLCKSPEANASKTELEEARRRLKEMDEKELRSLLEQIQTREAQDIELAISEYRKSMPTGEQEIFEAEIRPYLEKRRFDRANENPFTFLKDDAARWIYHRAHSYGWTKERFEAFDNIYIRGFDRHRPALERIGKKYQYIALHELHARLSDNCKLLESVVRKDILAYEGPWQLYERDIDPSLLIDRARDPGWRSAPLPVWWCPYHAEFDLELSAEELQSWLWSHLDIPDFTNLLIVNSFNQKFTVMNTFWHVRQRDGRRIDPGLPVREVRGRVQAAIVKRSDADVLKTHILQAGRNRPGVQRGASDLRDDTVFHAERSDWHFYLGEWPWHPSTSGLSHDWKPAAHEPGWWSYPVPIVSPVVEYMCESGAGDMSVTETVAVMIPSSWLIRSLGLRFTDGRKLAFSDESGRIVFCDPSVAEEGPRAGLVDTEIMARLLEREQLALVWAVGGEKNVYEPLFYGRHCFSGLFHWDGTGSDVSGELWTWQELPEGGPTKIR